MWDIKTFKNIQKKIYGQKHFSANQIFSHKQCAKLTESIPTKISYSYHLIDIFDTLNVTGITVNTMLVSFDIVKVFPSIEQKRGVAAMKTALDSTNNLSPSTESILKALEICLANNNSVLAGQNLIKTNGTAMGAACSCSYQIWEFNQ